MVEQDYIHSSDPLENLSYLVGRCLVCGQEHREALMGESEYVFCLCNCGDVVKIVNKTRWN